MKKRVSLLLALILSAAFCVAGAQAASFRQYPWSPDNVPTDELKYEKEMAVKGAGEIKVYVQPGEFGTTNTSAVLATLAPGATVWMLKYDITGNWVRVLYNDGNNAGWVLVSSLEKPKDP